LPWWERWLREGAARLLTWLHWRLSDFAMFWLWPASRCAMGYTWPSLYEEFTEAQREDIRGFKRVVEQWPDGNNRMCWLRMFTLAEQIVEVQDTHRGNAVEERQSEGTKTEG